MRNLSSLIAMLVLFVTPISSARNIELWSYDALFKSADLVVIGTAQGTVDNGARFPENRWAGALTGEQTTFVIERALQGKPPGGALKVNHFRYTKDAILTDGPLLVSFRTKPIILAEPPNGHISLGTPQYLLFLKATSDGSWEPVSGQADAQLSVKEIYCPLPDLD